MTHRLRDMHQRSFCCLNIMQIKPVFIHHQAPNDTLFVCLFFVSFVLVLLILKQPQEVLIFFINDRNSDFLVIVSPRFKGGVWLNF